MTRQPREQQCPCGICGSLTWNLSARCDRHPIPASPAGRPPVDVGADGGAENERKQP